MQPLSSKAESEYAWVTVPYSCQEQPVTPHSALWLAAGITWPWVHPPHWALIGWIKEELGAREEGNECNGGISRRVIAVRLRPQPHQEKRFIKFSIHVYRLRRFNVTKILLILYLTFFLFEHSLHFMQVSFVLLNLCDISPCWQLTL